jgi:hypothetical protein
MPTHPQEEEIEIGAQREQEKEEWEPPPSPSKEDIYSKTQNPNIMHEQPCYESVIIDETYYYSDESDDDMPINDFLVQNMDFDDKEEYVLDMLYDIML